LTAKPESDRSADIGLRRYREIRSARFPGGLPDRSDATVIEAFGDAWLLIQHAPDGAELVGVAEDYDAARAWLTEPDGADDQSSPGCGQSQR
jgi:hypothetical protein